MIFAMFLDWTGVKDLSIVLVEQALVGLVVDSVHGVSTIV
jgi:hypothetical protein